MLTLSFMGDMICLVQKIEQKYERRKIDGI